MHKMCTWLQKRLSFLGDAVSHSNQPNSHSGKQCMENGNGDQCGTTSLHAGDLLVTNVSLYLSMLHQRGQSQIHSSLRYIDRSLAPRRSTSSSRTDLPWSQADSRCRRQSPVHMSGIGRCRSRGRRHLSVGRRWSDAWYLSDSCHRIGLSHTHTTKKS